MLALQSAFIPAAANPLHLRSSNRLPQCPRAATTRTATPRVFAKASTPSSVASKVLSYVQQRSKEDTQRVRDLVSSSEQLKSVAVACAAALMLSVSALNVPSALADVPTSAPEEAIYDDAKVIPKGNQQLFNKAADAIEKSSGYHLHFLMLRSLPYGDTPSDYAEELAKDWNLGKEDVLFVASTKLARAGFYLGDDVKSVLSNETAVSVAEQTYAVAAGEDQWGSAVLDVSNRLIPIFSGEADPGPPNVPINEVYGTYKTKQETKKDRGKYIKVVGGVLAIAFIAPLIQTYWYVRND